MPIATDNANLFAHYKQVFDQYPSKAALVLKDESVISYAQLDAESSRIAAYLVSLGSHPGDRVSVQVDKSPQALYLYLACLRAGLVFHPLNSGYKEEELSYFISNAKPTVIVCDESNSKVMQRLATKNDIKHLETLNSDGSGTLMASVASLNGSLGVEQCTPDGLAALLYSSGTTGVPKGIKLTHNNLLSNAHSLVDSWGFTESDVLLHALPIFHVHGLFVALGCVFLSGSTMRWQKSFNNDETIANLPHVTAMMGVPTYYTRLLADARFSKELVNKVRLFISGSAPLLEETFTEFEARTGHRILERYGMTETNMNTSNPLNGERKPGTVGLPLPGVELRIVNDNGRPVEQGEVGSIQVRGQNVFKGYWKLPEKTAEDFTDDGFFNTGDKGRLDEDGYVAIVGRAKDMVITGGLNVYPKELELLIDDMHGVSESAVIGVPHKDFGEGIVALVVPTTSDGLDEKAMEESIIAELKERLSAFKVPKRVLCIDELPRNAMSKVQKNILRELYSDLLI